MAHYLLGRELGRGATGVVYAALDVRNGSSVAIKRSSLTRCSTLEAIASLKREIAVLSRLQSPHIVRYIGSFTTDETINLVTEFVEGGSVAGLVARHGPLPETLASFLVAQALCGLDYLHTEGLLHRDVKAANMLINKHGVLKLADLGLVLDIKAAEPASARRDPSNVRSDTAPRAALPPVSARSTGSTERSDSGSASNRGVAGSAFWWSPEIIELGVPTAAADIWALGATVIELVTGSPPYSEYGAIAACFRICSDTGPPMPSSASPKLREFLSACFTRDPIRRPTARALLNSTWIASSLDALEGDPSRTTHRLLKEVQLRREEGFERDDTHLTTAASGYESPGGSSTSLSGSMGAPSGPPESTHALKRTTSLQAVAEATAASTLRLVRPSANSLSAASPIHGVSDSPPSSSEVSFSTCPDGPSTSSSTLSPNLRIPWSPGGASLTSAATLLALSSPAATRGGDCDTLSDDETGTQAAAVKNEVASVTDSQDVARQEAHTRSLISELTPARYATRGGCAVRLVLAQLLAHLFPESEFDEVDEDEVSASAARVVRSVLEERSSLSTITQLIPTFSNDVIVRASAVRLVHTVAKGSALALEKMCDLGVPALIFDLILSPSNSPDELRLEAATFAVIFARTRSLLRSFLASGGVRVTLVLMKDTSFRIQHLGVSCGTVLSHDSPGPHPSLRAELIAAGALKLTTNCLMCSLRAVVAGLFAEDCAATTTPLTVSTNSLHRATSLTSWALSSASSVSNTSQTLSSTAERASVSTSPNGSEVSSNTPDFRALPLSAPPLDFCTPSSREKPGLPLVSSAVEDAIRLISQCAVFIAALASDVGVRPLLAERPLLTSLLRVFRPSPLALLTHGTYSRAVSRATRALKYVSLHETNATELAACDAVPILVSFFARSTIGLGPEQDEGTTVTLLAALFNLLRFSRARSATAAAVGIVEPLLQLASARSSPISTRALSVQLLCDLSRSADLVATRESLFSAQAPAVLARLIGTAHAPLSAHCLGIISSLAAVDAARTAAALLAMDARGLRAVDIIVASFTTTNVGSSENGKIIADLAAPLAALVGCANAALNEAFARAPRFLSKIAACAEASAALLSDADTGARAALLLRQLLGILAAAVKELPSGEELSGVRAVDDSATVESIVRGIAARVEGRVVLENGVAEVIAAIATLRAVPIA